MPLNRNSSLERFSSLERLGIYIITPNLELQDHLDDTHNYQAWLDNLNKHKKNSNFFVSQLPIWDILKAHKVRENHILIIFIDYNDLTLTQKNTLEDLVKTITHSKNFANCAVVMRNKPQDLTQINGIEVYTDNESAIEPLLQKYERKTPEAIQDDENLTLLLESINELLKQFSDCLQLYQQGLSEEKKNALANIKNQKLKNYQDIKLFKDILKRNTPILEKDYTIANVLLDIITVLLVVGIGLNIYQYKTAGNFGFFAHNHPVGKKARELLNSVELKTQTPFIP